MMNIHTVYHTLTCTGQLIVPKQFSTNSAYSNFIAGANLNHVYSTSPLSYIQLQLLIYKNISHIVQHLCTIIVEPKSGYKMPHVTV